MSHWPPAEKFFIYIVSMKQRKNYCYLDPHRNRVITFGNDPYFQSTLIDYED